MTEYKEDRRLTRRKKKKLRIGRVMITFLLFTFILLGVYSVIQYNAGKSLAQGNSIEPEDFIGNAIDPNFASIENYLLLGIDNDGSGRSRTDTMIVLSWDKTEGTMKLVSLMRDIYAEIPGYQSYKLNTAYYLGGIQTIKDTITGMFGIPIHHYAIVDFKNFESLIDIAFPNGVEVNVQKEMSEKIGVTLYPGVQQLNGQELLGFARFRADAEGDFGRVARQQEVLQAVKQEAVNPRTLFTIPKLAGALGQYVQTDLSEIEELSRALTFVMKKGADMESLTIPVENSYSFTNYRHAGSVIELDLEKNRQEIANFLNIPLE